MLNLDGRKEEEESGVEEGGDGEWGDHQEAKRHMKEQEESYLWRDGAGNSGLRNHLRRRRRAGREKQSQPKRASVKRGYLPENETESAFVLLVSSLCPLGLKSCRSWDREERWREGENWQWLESGAVRCLLTCSLAERGSNVKSKDIADVLSWHRWQWFWFFFRLSGVLNCWLTPMNTFQKHFKELSNSTLH